jgi:serine/threonine-protein kinase HipA
MAVSNTDDHLRNHGFLLTPFGWKLSPLFDVNPVPFGDRLSLNITELDDSIDPALAIEVAEYFGLSKPEAEKVLDEIAGAVQKNWIEIAERTGLSRDAVEYMRPAFSLQT